MPFEAGQIVSDYEILDVIGKGGMGRVYRVRNVISGRIEAMKVLLSDFAGEAEIGERFGGEIRTLASFDHPNIAKLHTALRLGNESVMFMEFVEGQTLTDAARNGPIPLPQLLSYVSQTLAALEYAHKNGVVHRDIKPSNIMVTPQGVVKLMDFGIAKSARDNLQTRAGVTMGSLSYMSPEQVRASGVDARSDIYSMGMVLYELAVGRRPFDFESTYAVMDAQLNTMPAPPIEVNPSLPKALNDVIMRAVEKDPNRRFQSAEEFRDSVERVAKALESPTVPVAATQPSRMGMWIGIAAALVVIVAAVLGYVLIKKYRGNTNTAPVTSVAPTATQAPVPAPAPAELPKELHFPSGDMVLVQGGEAHLGEHRTPAPVRSFYIDKTEVSLGAYRQFCREKSMDPPAGSAGMSADMPVVNISYFDASRFAAWAGKRLPTANEWELAARGLDGLTFPWGSTFQSGLANLKAGGAGHLMPVHAYPKGASPAGALNMLGNASELVDTECEGPTGMFFERYRTVEFKDLNPPLSPREPYYQARGGSFRIFVPAKDLPTLIWDHTPFPARARQPDVGFRCAREADH